MTSHSYLVVMIDYGRKGRESIVDPEITRREVIDRIRTREYDRIAFIHEVFVSDEGSSARDITNELLAEAGFYAEEVA
jgi:hypothetical protein